MGFFQLFIDEFLKPLQRDTGRDQFSADDEGGKSLNAGLFRFCHILFNACLEFCSIQTLFKGFCIQLQFRRIFPQALRGKVPELFAVGDCVEPMRLMCYAIHEGHAAAKKL